MVLLFDVSTNDDESLHVRIPHPPGRSEAEAEAEERSDVHMSPKRFQEEITRRIHLHETRGAWERDPPPTAEGQRTPHYLQCSPAPMAQNNRSLASRNTPRRLNEAIVIKQQSTKSNSRNSNYNVDATVKPIYFNLPAGDEHKSTFTEFPIPIIDANKRSPNYVTRTTEPIYALQRKYRNKIKRNEDNKSSIDSENNSDTKYSHVKGTSNRELSKCDALGLTSVELARLDRRSRSDVNVLPRPVERFPYKPLRASTFVIARRKSANDQETTMRRSSSQHNLATVKSANHSNQHSQTTNHLSVRSFERMAKDALVDQSRDGSPAIPAVANLQSALKSPDTVGFTGEKPDYETPVPFNSCKTSEANFDAASPATRSAKGATSSAMCDIALNDIDGIISDDPATYAPRDDRERNKLDPDRHSLTPHVKWKADLGTKAGHSTQGQVSVASGGRTVISTGGGLDECVVIQRHQKQKPFLHQPRYQSPARSSKHELVRNVKARNITPSQSASLANGFKASRHGFDTSKLLCASGSDLASKSKRQPNLNSPELKARNQIKPSTNIVFRSRYAYKFQSQNGFNNLRHGERVPKLELVDLADDVLPSGFPKRQNSNTMARTKPSDDENFRDFLLASWSKENNTDNGDVTRCVIEPTSEFYADREAEMVMLQADSLLTNNTSKSTRIA